MVTAIAFSPSRMRSLISTLLVLGAACVVANAQGPAENQRVVFPRDPSVIDAQLDLGAKGDGLADDTEALQRGLDASCGADGLGSRVLYLPNGTYRVTQTLIVKHPVGPWLFGESRDGVVIKLDDAAANCNSVLRTHPNESGGTSADWFMRNLRNFTIDVGNNPETDGIRYFATNSGSLKNVRVTGRGKIGVNAGFLGQSGPNLIQDVEIDGFETGILSQWIWGETLSRVTIRNCRKQGVYVSANAVAIEDLTVENTPIGLYCDFPNDWTWWGGVVALVGARFSGGDPNGAAIVNRSILFARDVSARGFAHVVENPEKGVKIAGPSLDQYTSDPHRQLFDSPPASLNLPIEREPTIPWETDPTKWLCANDFGAVAGDNQDDTAAIQKAIDSAAAAGKSVVYLRGSRGPDPNWYNVNGTVHVHGSVRMFLGLGFGRILGGPEGRIVVDEASAPAVKFLNIDAFGGPPVILENRSSSKTLVVESCGVKVLASGAGKVFMTDCPSLLEVRNPKARVWARQLNPEGDSDDGLVQNRGGTVWALGVKSEGRGIRFRTTEGGKTEVVGMFMYGPGIPPDDKRPMFDIDNASLSIAGLREIVFDAPSYNVKVRERRDAEIRSYDVEREGGWIGWALFSGRNDSVRP